MPGAGAASWLAGLGLGVPDSEFCMNATYAQRLDDPVTFNFCRCGARPGMQVHGCCAVQAGQGEGGSCIHVSKNLTAPPLLHPPCLPACPCSVPGSGPDAFLFAALAVLVACCLHFSSLSAVFVLVAGALAEGLVFPFNLGR